jgi:hypothetical protein
LRYFEAAGSRFIGVVDLDTPTAMRLSGLPRADAKIARGDVAQWLVALFAELDRVLNMTETVDEENRNGCSVLSCEHGLRGSRWP